LHHQIFLQRANMSWQAEESQSLRQGIDANA
jgi:hypothetical protein